MTETKKIENELNKNQNELDNATNIEIILLTEYKIKNSNRQILMQKLNDFVKNNSKSKNFSFSNLKKINLMDNQNKNSTEQNECAERISNGIAQAA